MFARQFNAREPRGEGNRAKIPAEWRDAKPAFKRIGGTAADGSYAAPLNCYRVW
jgi:hypothetical protein